MVFGFFPHTVGVVWWRDGLLPVPRRPTISMIVGQGPIALAVDASGGCLAIFPLSFLSFFSFPLADGLIQTEILSR